MDRVKTFFKPEFINRLDSLIIFNILNEEMTEKIIEIQLDEIALQIIERKLKPLDHVIADFKGRM